MRTKYLSQSTHTDKCIRTLRQLQCTYTVCTIILSRHTHTHTHPHTLTHTHSLSKSLSLNLYLSLYLKTHTYTHSLSLSKSLSLNLYLYLYLSISKHTHAYAHINTQKVCDNTPTLRTKYLPASVPLLCSICSTQWLAY